MLFYSVVSEEEENEDDKGLWEEHFNGFDDKKPFGIDFKLILRSFFHWSGY